MEDKKLLNAAGCIDGYMKLNRPHLNEFELESFHIAIRVLIEQLSSKCKKKNKEYISVLISNESDWNRFRDLSVHHSLRD